MLIGQQMYLTQSFNKAEQFIPGDKDFWAVAQRPHEM